MTTFPNSPRLDKGAIVWTVPGSTAVERIMALHYHPDTFSRTLQGEICQRDG
jgi:hypothetical protein